MSAGVGRADVFAVKTLADMTAEVVEYLEAKGWKGPDSPTVTFGDAIALLHSEVSEALEAFRDWGAADATAPTADWPCPPPKPEGVGSEFADVLIRLLDSCDRFGVDLAAEYERKMAYNRTRAWRHGGRAL